MEFVHTYSQTFQPKYHPKTSLLCHFSSHPWVSLEGVYISKDLVQAHMPGMFAGQLMEVYMPDMFAGHLAGHRMLSRGPYKAVVVALTAEEPGRRYFSLILMEDMMEGVRVELWSCSLSSLVDKPLVVYKACPVAEKLTRAAVGYIVQNVPFLVDRLWGAVGVYMGYVVGS